MDLLEDPANRPKQFARGYDVYDQQKVGFVYDTSGARARGISLRHDDSRQRQRRASVGNDASGGSEAGSDRVHEDAVESTSYEQVRNVVRPSGLVGHSGEFRLGAAGLFLPDEMLAMFSLPSASPSMWPSFAALLLILVSLFYIPAAKRRCSIAPVAWLAVLARLAGVIFFCIFNRDYFMFGLFDLIFFVPESILLTLAVREAKNAFAAARRKNIAEATPGTNCHLGAPASGSRLVAIASLHWLLIGAGLTYYEFFRTVPPPYFASERGTLSLWLDRHRSHRGSAVLDLAGAAARISGQAAVCRADMSRSASWRRKGANLPIGFSKQTIGIERVGINCAFCHTATYRDACELTSR